MPKPNYCSFIIDNNTKKRCDVAVYSFTKCREHRVSCIICNAEAMKYCDEDQCSVVLCANHYCQKIHNSKKHNVLPTKERFWKK